MESISYVCNEKMYFSSLYQHIETFNPINYNIKGELRNQENLRTISKKIYHKLHKKYGVLASWHCSMAEGYIYKYICTHNE